AAEETEFARGARSPEELDVELRGRERLVDRETENVEIVVAGNAPAKRLPGLNRGRGRNRVVRLRLPAGGRRSAGNRFQRVGRRFGLRLREADQVGAGREDQ